MEISVNDREMIMVMKCYFQTKVELAELKAQLEAARQATGADIGTFYDPRTNAEHADDLRRTHILKHELASLMDRAEAWARAEIAADRVRRVEAISPE